MEAAGTKADPKALYQAGRLGDAIQALTQEVRANPTDDSRRTFLFELLCFAGDWDRAEKQIDAVGAKDAASTLAVQIYKALIAGEKSRARLFADGLAPHFLKEPPPHVDLHLAAIGRVREGNLAEARELLDKAEEERPLLAATLNGEPVEDFRDADDFFAPVLELIVKDKYTWLPLEQLRSVEISEPKKLRDLVWAPAKIEAIDGTIGEVFIPALYIGSSGNDEEAVKLGRLTDWQQLGNDLTRGVGLRTFAVGEDDRSIFEVRRLEVVGVSAP